jgi:hypothetical protein
VIRGITSSLLFIVFLSQQPSSAVQGVVVQASSNRPIGKTTVELRASTSETVIAETQTDSEGKFYLRGSLPAAYRVTVRRPGFVSTTVSISAAQGGGDLRLTMTAAGVVSGRITDRGSPVALADVVAIPAISTEGRLSFTPVLATRTNDLGEYSLSWLPPGRYYVIGIVWDTPNSLGYYVTPDGNDSNSYVSQRFVARTVFVRPIASGVSQDEAHVPIYYPGTSDPQFAKAVEVFSGGVVRGVDIDAAPVRLGRVRGRVVGVQGRNSVDMRPVTWTIYTTSAQRPNASTDEQGNFEMTAVPGRYTLTAFAGELETYTFLDVRPGDVTNAVISVSPGLTLNGSVVVDGASADSAKVLSSLRVSLRPDPLPPGVSSFQASSIQPDGSFTIPPKPVPGAKPEIGPPEGDFRVLVAPILIAPTQPGNTPPVVPTTLQSFYVKSIRMGDVDVLENRLRLTSQTQGPLVIVVGTNPGTLDGRVLDTQQQPVAGATVVLVHDNGLRFRVDEKTVSTDDSGRFEFHNVPPGNYKLLAWERVEAGSWQDPDFMRSFESSATALHIEEGHKTSAEVRVIPVR